MTFTERRRERLNDEEKPGLQLFVDSGCAACRGGVNLGGNGYHPFGHVQRPGADILPEGDRGRFQVTGTVDDECVFRAAPLRNIAVTAPCFHSGVVWDLRTAVDVTATSQLGADLDDAQIDAITAFLGSLTGLVPEIVCPILPPETDTTPRPTGEVMPQGGSGKGGRATRVPLSSCPEMPSGSRLSRRRRASSSGRRRS